MSLRWRVCVYKATRFSNDAQMAGSRSSSSASAPGEPRVQSWKQMTRYVSTSEEPTQLAVRICYVDVITFFSARTSSVSPDISTCSTIFNSWTSSRLFDFTESFSDYKKIKRLNKASPFCDGELQRAFPIRKKWNSSWRKLSCSAEEIVDASLLLGKSKNFRKRMQPSVVLHLSVHGFLFSSVAQKSFHWRNVFVTKNGARIKDVNATGGFFGHTFLFPRKSLVRLLVLIPPKSLLVYQTHAIEQQTFWLCLFLDCFVDWRHLLRGIGPPDASSCLSDPTNKIHGTTIIHQTYPAYNERLNLANTCVNSAKTILATHEHLFIWGLQMWM